MTYLTFDDLERLHGKDSRNPESLNNSRSTSAPVSASLFSCTPQCREALWGCRRPSGRHRWDRTLSRNIRLVQPKKIPEYRLRFSQGETTLHKSVCARREFSSLMTRHISVPSS